MASHWSSKLVVYKDGSGRDYVSTALPMGVVEVSQVQMYDAAGPYMPIGWPKPEQVGNATAWMADMRKKGFTFTPSTV